MMRLQLIQALKDLLEHPATIFIPKVKDPMTAQPQRPTFGPY